MIKVGIIGCGKIAQVRHIPEYFSNPDCQIIGLYDVNQKNADRLAEKYQIRSYGSIEQLLGDEIDAVSVCTSNSTHAEMSVKALRAGKHVLCEKPMAVTAEQCNAMCLAAKESGKLLMIGQNQRFTPSHQKAKELISSGAIGKVLAFRTTFGHPGPEAWANNPNSWFFDKTKAHFGAMADLGVHKTDLIRYLLDDDISEVYSQFGTLDKTFPDGSPITVDDNAFCIYRTEKGAIGMLHASWTLYGNSEDNSTRIYGSKGILKIYEDPDYSLIFEHKNGEVEKYQLDMIANNKDQSDELFVSTGVIDHFINSIQGKTRCIITGDEAFKSMKVVFAAEESDKTGQKITL